MSSEENKGRSGLVIGLLAVFVLALGVLLYLRSEEKHALELDKQELTVELSGLKEDLMGQIGENDSLNSFIEAETARLGLLIDSINAVNVDNKKQLTNYRYRLSSLKKQNAELVEQLDSTNEAYAALKMREQMVADSLNSAITANQALSGQNSALSNTVAKGKQLVIAASSATAARITNSGKERKTKRAKKTDRVNVCITIAKNRIADSGERTLYVKLFAPNGKAVDAPEKNIAVVAGENSGYNGIAKVNFQGEAMDVCIAANRATDAPIVLEPGIYTAAILTESYLLGTVAVELK
jgi:L-lactate utilization protein LutC